MLTDKQKKVIEFARRNGNCITKKDAMGLINTHYHNGEKHVGETLSRMVKAGLLIRLKPGVFKIGNGKRLKELAVVENQVQMF